jgi:hypothetical protein
MTRSWSARRSKVCRSAVPALAADNICAPTKATTPKPSAPQRDVAGTWYTFPAKGKHLSDALAETLARDAGWLNAHMRGPTALGDC